MRRLFFVLLVACSSPGNSAPDGATAPDGNVASPDAMAPDAALDCGTPAQCMAQWEQAASDAYDAALGDPTALKDFLHAVPKGGDLHNHLTGAVWAETYL